MKNKTTKNNVIPMADNVIKVTMQQIVATCNSGAFDDLRGLVGISDGSIVLSIARITKRIEEEATLYNKILQEKKVEIGQDNSEEINKEFVNFYNNLLSSEVTLAGKKIGFSAIKDCKVRSYKDGKIELSSPSVNSLLALDWLIDLEA